MEKATELNLIDIADDLLILNRRTIETLMQLENCAECIALYVFYYKTAKWQKNSSVKASDKYVMDCLKWGRKKLTDTKKTLKECGLIEIIQRRKDNKITGWYVKINYVISQRRAEDIKIHTEEEKPTENKEEMEEPEEATSIKSKKYQKQQVPKATSSFQNTNTINKNKILINKNKILKEKSKKEKTLKRFSAPKVEEVRAYCNERKNNIDPEAFIDYYQSKGWTIGKNAPMKDWKAAVRTWERKNFRKGNDYKKEKEPEHREPTDLDLEYIAAVERFNKNL